MQNMDLAEQVRHIKRSLRGVMNGPVSACLLYTSDAADEL